MNGRRRPVYRLEKTPEIIDIRFGTTLPAMSRDGSCHVRSRVCKLKVKIKRRYLGQVLPLYDAHGRAWEIMADGVGFEPTKGVNPCWFSRPVPSTARPPILRRRYVYGRGVLSLPFAGRCQGVAKAGRGITDACGWCSIEGRSRKRQAAARRYGGGLRRSGWGGEWGV